MPTASVGHGTRCITALLVLLATAVCGCRSKPPRFAVNAEGREPIAAEQEQSIVEALAQLCGTPDAPKSPRGAGLDAERLTAAAGPVRSDEEGNLAGLYRKHCVLCHGIAGDGAGPNAAVLSPYPRDFRRGVFKFTSTLSGAKPTADDLEDTLRRGVPGTAMPSFDTLGDREIAALVEYVKYLSIRGEVELALVRLIVDLDDPPQDLDAFCDDELLPVVGMWVAAGKQVLEPSSQPTANTPQERAAAIVRGQRVYISENAKCVSCHGPEGRGDGPQNPLYDDWNKSKLGTNAAETQQRARLFRLPIQSLRPRDFTAEKFRGGDRPADLYRRVHASVKGTPMPAHGPTPGNRGALTPEQIRDVLEYVRSLQ
jgi:mono/diheme cytochrome c family protein